MGPVQETMGPVQETMGPVQETMPPQNIVSNNMDSDLNTDLFDLLQTAEPVDVLDNDLDLDSNTKIFESVEPLETQQPTREPTREPTKEPTTEPIVDLQDSDLNIFNKETEQKNKVGCFPNTPNEGLLISSIAANSAAF